MRKRHHATDDFEIINGKQVLRDHRTYRASVRLMDARRSPFTAADAKRHQPGFRTTDRNLPDREAVADREAAYAEYNKRISDAWRGGDAENFSEQNLGGVCTVQNEAYPLDHGSPGHIRRVGNKILCVPDHPRSRSKLGPEAATSDSADARRWRYAEPDDDEDDDDGGDTGGRYEETAEEMLRNATTHHESLSGRRSASRSVNQIAGDHQANMARIYADHDRLLTQAWRRS